MAERLSRLVKHFQFREQDRSVVTLGSDTRINPDTHRAQLKADANGDFPTTADLFVKSRLTNPESVRAWSGFEAVVFNKRDETNTIATSVGFRLSDGTDEFFWNGSTWIVSTTQWNTEADVANNIAAFSAAARQLQVIINLVTTDKRFTPEVERVKVLFDARIEFQEDLIYRSLLRLLRSSIRPRSRFQFTATVPTSTIDIAQFLPETPYVIVDVDAVFDRTVDPNRLDDLLVSYDTGTKIATLSTTIPVGNLVFLRFVYDPPISVTTSQDFIDADKVPSIVLSDIDLVEASEVGQDDSVANKDAGTAVIVPAPIQGDLDILLTGLTDKGVDSQRLADEVKRFFQNNKQLISTGLDEPYRLWLVDEYDMRTQVGQSEIHSFQSRLRIQDVLFWAKDAINSNVVKKLTIGGDVSVVVE